MGMGRSSSHSSRVLLLLLLLLLVASAAAAAGGSKVYTVGDAGGWGLGVDYTAWVADKTFKVGDVLVFNYPMGHTVDTVSKTDYDGCNPATDSSAESSISRSSSSSVGPTTIVLRSPGTHYFICGGTGHCVSGMKLAVKVIGTSSSGGGGGDHGGGGDSSSSGGGGGGGGDSSSSGGGFGTRIIYAPPPPEKTPPTTTTNCPPATYTTPASPGGQGYGPPGGQGYGYGPPPPQSYDGYSGAAPPYSPYSSTYPLYYSPPYDVYGNSNNKFSSSSSSAHPTLLRPSPYPVFLLTVVVAVVGLPFLSKSMVLLLLV